MVRLPPARTRTDTRFPSTTLFRSGDGTTIAVPAPMQGTVGSIAVSVGDEVAAGATVAVMEAMKMEHVVAAPRSGIVRSIGVSVGDAVVAGHELVVLVPAEVAASAGLAEDAVDLDRKSVV